MRKFETREKLILDFPSNAVVAEIGVCIGEFAEELVKTNPHKLYLIDCWAGSRSFEADDRCYQIVKSKFENHANVEIVKGWSVEVAKTFPDRYFDWVYLDSQHFYEDVLADLDAWHPKVKVGGIFAGHDYIKGPWWVKVVEALDKWMPEHGYDSLDYLTEEEWVPSWGFVVK